MSNLSIFIDESGDTGVNKSNIYIVTFLLHEQKNNIDIECQNLINKYNTLNVPNNLVFHAGPLIRKEDVFKGLKLNVRTKIFDYFINFAKKIDFKYFQSVIFKDNNTDAQKIDLQIVNDFNKFIQQNYYYLSKFAKIIIYYDNGQRHLSKCIKNIISNWPGLNIDFRQNCIQANYKLLQISDLLCSIELLNLKDPFSKSELMFFKTKRNFIKRYGKIFMKRKIKY